MADGRRQEFATFLRSRRERLRPEAFGLPIAGRRRTPGLRREEVAERAGISCEWYIRMEQGRAVAPSRATVDALARALRLDTVEHDYLNGLARDVAATAFAPERVPEELARLVASLSQPAYLTGRRWDVLAWNTAAAAIFPFDRLSPKRRNILLFMTTDPAAQALFGPTWADEAARMTALFRAGYAVSAGDPAFAALLSEARAGCPSFAGWWEAHQVRRPMAGRKVLHIAGRGALAFDYATFQSNDDPAIKLAIYTPTPLA